eukprot:3806607-Rhodomonas_salina.2
MHWIKNALRLGPTEQNASMSPATRTCTVEGDPENQMGFSTMGFSTTEAKTLLHPGDDSLHSMWSVFEKENQNPELVKLSSANSEVQNQAKTIEFPGLLDATRQLQQEPPSFTTASQLRPFRSDARQELGDFSVGICCAMPANQHSFAPTQLRRSAELEC